VLVVNPHRLHRDVGERRRLPDRQPVHHRLDEPSWSWAAAVSRTARATARNSLRRILEWLLATFALTLMFGLRRSTGSSAARICSISSSPAPRLAPVARTYRTGQVHAGEDRRDGGRYLVGLDVDLGVLVGGHPRSQAERAHERQQQAHPAEQAADPVTSILAGNAERNSAVHAHHSQGAIGIPVGPVHPDRRAVGPADEQRPVDPPRARTASTSRTHASNE
jgi:hypothetical protein